MTPRRDVEFIDLADGFDAIRQQLLSARRSRLPVRDGEPDSIIGVVLVREAVAALVEGGEFDIRQFVHEAPVVLDQVDALSVLRAIRSSIVHLALVYDEYGHFEGIVTSGDVLESIAGAFREEGDEGPSITERADGSYLVEGWMPVDEFAEHIGLVVARDVDYETVAGLVLSELKRLPRAGESVAIGDLDFEVVDLDGRRIDKVLVTRRPAEAGAEKGGSGPEEPSGSAP
jgi:putative hemolysin